jgi:hypothetical protein
MIAASAASIPPHRKQIASGTTMNVLQDIAYNRIGMMQAIPHQ